MDDGLKREALKAVLRARYRCIMQAPFFGALAMSMEIVICEEYMGKPVETAATDGKRMFYNPGYFLSLTRDEQFSLVIHETSHVALAHHLRRGRRNFELWNEATDQSVNWLIRSTGAPTGEHWLCDQQYKGWSAERVYGKVESEKEDGEAEGGSGSGGGNPDPGGTPTEKKVMQPGEVWDATDETGDPLTPSARAEAMKDLAQDLSNADVVHKEAGNSSEAGYERSINEVMSPSAEWSVLLTEFWSGSGAPMNETWKRPNRRYMPSGIWCPSVSEEGLDWVVIGIDVSGSIAQRECDAFISQIDSLRATTPAQRITLVPFNSSVQHKDIVEVHEGDDLPKKFRVGGGTRFASIVNWVRGQETEPDALIIFTDLGDSRYGEAPDCPVLWASSYPVYNHSNYTNKPPFGDVIEVAVS